MESVEEGLSDHSVLGEVQEGVQQGVEVHQPDDKVERHRVHVEAGGPVEGGDDAIRKPADKTRRHQHQNMTDKLGVLWSCHPVEDSHLSSQNLTKNKPYQIRILRLDSEKDEVRFLRVDLIELRLYLLLLIGWLPDRFQVDPSLRLFRFLFIKLCLYCSLITSTFRV